MAISWTFPRSIDPNRGRRAALAPAAALAVLALLAAAQPAAAASPVPPPAATAPLAAPPEGPCSEGVRLLRAHQDAAAEAALKECLRQGGERVEPLLLLTTFCLQRQRPADAAAYGKRAVAADSSSADAHYWYGRALLARGDAPAAKRQWELGLQLTSEHPGLLEALARVAMDEGQDARAYNLLTQLGRQGIDDPWLHRLLSDLARRKGMWDTALEHWRRVVQKEGENPETLLRACELSILAGDTTGAVGVCERAVKAGDTAAAHGSLGEALFAAGRYDESLSALRRAVELAPDESRYRFNLANLLEVMGRPEDADEQFRRFVALDPEDPIGRLNYGIHLDRMGRSGEALLQIEAALAAVPDLVAARVVQAQLLEKEERFEEAVEVVDELLARGDGVEKEERLRSWRERLAQGLAQRDKTRAEGGCRLLHIVAPDTTAVRLVRRDLARGIDFAVVATRYSVGATAARGGELGWVVPDEMVEPLRSAIRALKPDQVSPPILSRGAWHFFKRVR